MNFIAWLRHNMQNWRNLDDWFVRMRNGKEKKWKRW
jgi:hypothetical protein